jgi:hypothetical protein
MSLSDLKIYRLVEQQGCRLDMLVPSCPVFQDIAIIFPPPVSQVSVCHWFEIRFANICRIHSKMTPAEMMRGGLLTEFTYASVPTALPYS